MPSPYRRDVVRLKVEVAARVGMGESLRAIGAVAGLPCQETVRKWATADPGFAAELAAARARAGSLELRYDEAVAAGFLARALAGEAINDLLREPGMPSRRAYRHWQATAAGFAAAVAALRARRDRAIGAHGRARFRAWDRGLAEAILRAVSEGATLDEALARDPALPCRPTLRRWRAEQPAFDAALRMLLGDGRRRRAVARDCIPQVAEDITDAIAVGHTFATIAREGGPSRTTLRRWVKARPDFAADVARACELRDDWFHEQVVAVAVRTPPGGVAGAKRAVGPILRHMTRLRHRPRAVHRRRGGDQPSNTAHPRESGDERGCGAPGGNQGGDAVFGELRRARPTPRRHGRAQRALGRVRDRGPLPSGVFTVGGLYRRGSGGGNWAITRAPLQSSRA